MRSIPTEAWAAITAIVGVFAGWIAKRGPDRANAASQLTTASVALVNELQEQNQSLRDEISELKEQNHKLRQEVRDLTVQVDRLQRSIDKMGTT